MIGNDDCVRAGARGDFGIFGIHDPFEDQLAAPALLDPCHIAPIERRVKLFGRPFGQGAHAVDTLDVADDVAKAAPLGPQHAQPPARFGHHVEKVGKGRPGRDGQSILQVLVALADDLQVQREHQRRAVGGFGAVNQAGDVVAVTHHIELKPERVPAGFPGHVFNRADAHGGQGERDAEFLRCVGRLDFAIGALHAGQARGGNGDRHGDFLADHGAGGAAVFHVDGHALAQFDGLEVCAVGAVGGLGPRTRIDILIEHARHAFFGQHAKVFNLGDYGHKGAPGQCPSMVTRSVGEKRDRPSLTL